MASTVANVDAVYLPTPRSSGASEDSLDEDYDYSRAPHIDGPFKRSGSVLGPDVPVIPKSSIGLRDLPAIKPNLALDAYIPLGTITVPFLVTNRYEWVELDSDFLPSSFLGHPVYRELPRLVIAYWARLFVRQSKEYDLEATLRVYILPDDVARMTVSRDDKKSRACLRGLMVNIDNSPEAWAGDRQPAPNLSTYVPSCSDQDSLFYIFNTLESPLPDADNVSGHYASEAMHNILYTSLRDRGLKTELYPYQRRSAATMICRESAPAITLDPRLESLVGPTGRHFYFDRDAGQVVADKRTFDEARGGILAETMGYGKTLICLAMTLATKNTLPEIPPEHLTKLKNRNTGIGCRSLGKMAAGAIARHGLPWKHILNDLRRDGQFHDTSAKLLKDTISTYEIHTEVHNRRLSTTVVDTLHLVPTTLIVVPPNLLSQWKRETEKHLEPTAMSILVVDDREPELPDAASLGDFDMILMSRSRFEEETRGRISCDAPSRSEAPLMCRCHINKRLCPEHEYRSPLLDAHFLRFIVDEGQGFVSSATKTHALAGLQSIKVDRKWIVSGTPASGLIGVEVDLAAETSSDSEVAQKGNLALATGQSRSNSASVLCASSNDSFETPVQKTLVNRRKNQAFDQERKDIERLGHIVKSFLGLKPWANGVADGDAANWRVHVVPSSSGARKPLSLRSVLSSLVVRHRIEDIEKDLQLPPLYNRIVKLQPSFFDKLSVNLFILSLMANAVTSEREDQDYMFHSKNRKNLEVLVRNMRSSAFFWSGFTEHDISETVRVSLEYLEKHEETVSDSDRRLLQEAAFAGETAIHSAAWKAFSRTSEIGLYVDNFPQHNATTWALCARTDEAPMLTGATQLASAKALVEKELYASQPMKALANGPSNATSLESAVSRNLKPQKSPKKGRTQTENPEPGKGIPKSSVQESIKLTSGQFAMHSAGSKRSSSGMTKRRGEPSSPTNASTSSSILKPSPQSKPPIPQSYAALAKPRLVGTSSVKLSYLLDRIVELQAAEKILVFYEADHIAYYCAQALEVLGIPHFIYASGITLKMRTEYLNMFNSDETERVMLMDIKQAAHGLHVASASRVFFINPVWQANIEAQAIKRAHRIGQTRPVYVETLVLQDTIEDQMLQRRKNMTTQEQQKASKSLLDDATMSNMIKAMKSIPFTEAERTNERSHVAPLQKPQQVFARYIAEQYTDDELNAFVASNPCTETESGTSPNAEASTKSNPTANHTEEDTHGPPAKKRRIMFADETKARVSESPTHGDNHDLPMRSSENATIVSTPPPIIRRSAQPSGAAVDTLVSWGDSPPLSALQPRRTIRFADEASRED